MPHLNIVTGIRRITQKQLLPKVSQKWKHQFEFGMKAYALRSFQSATGNARMVVANPNTASRKSERLLANLKLADQLGQIFDTFKFVKPTSYVNVDHSDMHDIVALVGAVQTDMGRAIPCMVEATYASTIPADGSSMSTPRLKHLRAAMVASRQYQSLTGHVIDSLQNFADRLGFWPRLVFDRGFGSESLIRHLVAEEATFYIRLKAGRYVTMAGERYRVDHLKQADANVLLSGLQLRVVRSPQTKRCEEPWYILTNDFASSRNKIIKIYYHRFEIEETFRDIKHIWELKRTRLNKPNSVKTILWFVALGIASLYLLLKPDKFEQRSPNPKKRISWLRRAQEAYLRDLGRLAWAYG